MTDGAETVAGVVGMGATSAGRLLRDARQAQGLHIAALATSIKVSPRKLELLETDRIDELPDPAFTRALAQTVCRALKIDPVPVLRLLPALSDRRLETVGEGLNTPFRDRPGQLVPNDMSWLRSPALWLPLLLLLAALVVLLAPAGWFERATSGLSAARDRSAPASAPAATTTAENNGLATSPLADTPAALGAMTAAVESKPSSAPTVSMSASASPVNSLSIGGAGTVANTVVDSPAPKPLVPSARLAPTPTPTSPPAPAPTGMLQLRTSAASWVEITDARGRSLLARLLQPGESVGVDGVLPLKVRIGNAGGTQLSFRGQPLSLASYTRDNVARLELK